MLPHPEPTRSADSESGYPAVSFRGQSFRQEKQYWLGTHRACTPAETLERIRPYFRKVGLTRLANVTHLDRLGIPTVLSIRPNSSNLSVDAGKGYTLEAAKVSAAMEALERWAAENARLVTFRSSYEDLDGSFARIPIDRILTPRDAHFNPRFPYTWTLGWDLVHQRETAVPALSVNMPSAETMQAELGTFIRGSNGLASGNSFLEALLAGLLEVVERDAVSCHRWAQRRAGVHPPLVRLETVEQPMARDLIDRFEAARVQPVLFDCTGDTGVPTFMAMIYDLEVRNIGRYGGYGAHLDPEIAMVRALTEAAQARMIFIAGSRDDFFTYDYRRLKRLDCEAGVEELAVLTPSIDARELTSTATDSIEGDIHQVLDRLHRVGLDQIIAFDLTPEGFELGVARVIVPGLEDYMFEYYAAGPRAQAYLERVG